MKKAENQWTEHDVSGVLMNPVYAITLHPDLFGEHQEYVVSKDQWVEANARLIHTLWVQRDTCVVCWPCSKATSRVNRMRRHLKRTATDLVVTGEGRPEANPSPW